MRGPHGNSDSNTGQAGFTLVEVLVAIALTALIVTFLAGALNFSLKSWKASKDVDRIAEIDAARDFLRQLLSATEPVRMRDRDGNLRLVFNGESQRLEFVTAMPERHVKAGLYKASLYLVPDTVEGVFTLKLDLSPFNSIDAAAATHTHTVEPLTDLKDFKISYFGEQDPNAASEWLPQWNEANTLPSLIRIIFETTNGGSMLLTPLIAELNIE